ncbi:butyrate kinase [Ruegeria marisrubri]|uniref:Probable butyrate kinase n=1 Tax=Ruegeria marisrubri TaxID=1685379 RepID=A0A101CYH5_9RHOB|nr:butyrate kinase [Ruegeria marisrubri]KUJ85718.1 butyrate kinase [Ruegeria marisrubri]
MSQNAILAINPGTTTTRCALYAVSRSQVEVIAEQTLDHDESMMAGFPTIASQLGFRAAQVEAFLAEHLGNYELLACAGRGGMLTPVPAGVIEVNPALVEFALHNPVYHHASNLGAPLAYTLASQHGAPAFVVDPVSVDELSPVARESGFEEIPRFSFVHALNIRACGRRLARDLNKPFDELRAVVAHLGAGFSIAALLNGRLVDSSNRMEISPFTPERAGGLPPLPLIDLCYSGKYSREELLSKLYGGGGVFGLLGTKDIRRVEAMIEGGDKKAALVFEAMLYQTAKAVGAMASVASFDLDGIILTGGLSNSARVTGYLTDKLSRLAPIHVYPGSDECRALAEGAARAVTGVETPLKWPVVTERQVA